MPNLLFCMTPGVELKTWERIGILNRELKPYKEYIKKGWQVKILTFDKGEIPQLPEGIAAVKFSNYKLLWFLPLMHKELGKWPDLIKTNQSLSSWHYVFIARIWKKPILVRCGYVHGEYLETMKRKSIKVSLYQFLESIVFRLADCCQVPTKELSEWIQIKYKVSPEKINIVPNFVDIDIFKPIEGIAKIKRSVISIGRLEPVKRFDLLIKACAQIPDCALTIIGEGSQRQKLELLAKGLKINLNLPGNIANERLPEVLNRYAVFTMTSLWEGHPKALIEAMACGLPSVVVENAGTIAIIEDNFNCCSAKLNIEDIKDKISLLFNDIVLCKNISKNARGLVVNNYSFENCFLKEFRVVNSII